MNYNSEGVAICIIGILVLLGILAIVDYINLKIRKKYGLPNEYIWIFFDSILEKIKGNRGLAYSIVLTLSLLIGIFVPLLYENSQLSQFTLIRIILFMFPPLLIIIPIIFSDSIDIRNIAFICAIGSSILIRILGMKETVGFGSVVVTGVLYFLFLVLISDFKRTAGLVDDIEDLDDIRNDRYQRSIKKYSRTHSLNNLTLTEETFKKTDLNELDLRITNLMDTNIERAILFGIDLSGSDINGIDLSFKNLAGAKLEGAKLAGAKLNQVDLTGANLNNAILKGAEFIGATLKETELVGANIVSCNLSEVDFSDAVLTDADLMNANLQGAKLMLADLRGVNLRKAILVGANLARSNLRGANLTEADLSETDLHGANLEGAYLTRADLTNANLKDAFLKNTDFTDATMPDGNKYYPTRYTIEKLTGRKDEK
jgi:uncharacterized protein YjbI with pentapeptide repeats